jgi:chemotaxis signal transduction protein
MRFWNRWARIQASEWQADKPCVKYLTFRVARQDFAMEVGCVRGLIPTQEIVPLETPHSWLSGFSAIKGRDFPVVDLRSKLGIRHGSHGRQPCVIVVGVGTRLIGFVADRVSEVISARERDLRNGVLHTTGRSRKILDPNQILSEEELQGLWAAMPIP